MGNRDVSLYTSHKCTVRNSCSLKDGTGYGLFFYSLKKQSFIQIYREKKLFFWVTI